MSNARPTPISVAVTAGLLLLGFTSARAGHVTHGESRGYAVTTFISALYGGEDDCPDGLNQEPKWGDVLRKIGYTPEETHEILEGDSFEQEMRTVFRGRNGENVCRNPQSADDPGFKTVQGAVAFGMNLDGSDGHGAPAPNACKHENFTSPTGEAGIDNQWYRVVGCSKRYRRHGLDGTDPTGLSYPTERMREGERTILIELRGVDDEVNDPDVEVDIMIGADALTRDSNGAIQRDATLRISADKRWRNVVHGSIKNRVLTTDKVNLKLAGWRDFLTTIELRDARFQLELLPDGGLKGIVAGYHAWLPMYQHLAAYNGQLERSAGMLCPGFYYALQRMADGYPDPKTGQCTAISLAWRVEAVPAFLVPEESTKMNFAERR